MTGQVSEVKSTTVVRRYGILTICPPPLPLGGAQGGKMTNIAYLLVMTIDLTSETWYELANGAPGHHTVLYRSGIHAVLAEISHMRHFGLGAFLGHMAMDLVENGVVGQDPGECVYCKACQGAVGTPWRVGWA